MNNAVSIIIPTFNEAETIGRLLRDLTVQSDRIEIIVADGGSTDATVEIAADSAEIVRARQGRAAQMNTGAAAASGTILWFLHADCTIPPDAVHMICEALEDDRIVGGGFRWGLSGNKWYYGLCTGSAHIKNKIRRNLFGDMGIFVRANVFNKLGGYADIPFLEDVEFNGRLKKMGRTIILNEIIYSSDRRLLKKGPIKQFIKNYMIKTAYKLGFSPEYLKQFY